MHPHWMSKKKVVQVVKIPGHMVPLFTIHYNRVSWHSEMGDQTSNKEWLLSGEFYSYSYILVRFLLTEWHFWQPERPRFTKPSLRGFGGYGHEASRVLRSPGVSPNQVGHDVLPSRHFILHSGRNLNFEIIKSGTDFCKIFLVRWRLCQNSTISPILLRFPCDKAHAKNGVSFWPRASA